MSDIGFLTKDEFDKQVTTFIENELANYTNVITGEQFYNVNNNIKNRLDDLQHQSFRLLSEDESLDIEQKTAIRSNIVRGMDLKDNLNKINNHAINNGLMDKTFDITAFGAGTLFAFLNHDEDPGGGGKMDLSGEKISRQNAKVERIANKIPGASVYYDLQGNAELSISIWGNAPQEMER